VAEAALQVSAGHGGRKQRSVIVEQPDGVTAQKPPEDPEDSYVLLPDLGRHGGFVALFADGSYSRWVPLSALLS
jgi:hypothetical protein